MKSSLLLLAIFGVSLSVQEGYYHKQYQYKSSSSSYKNNELQHKTDDEEFSSVHGDLSGRDDPKVNAYTQHTEYRNPNSQDNLDATQFHNAGSNSRYQAQNMGYGSGPDDVTGNISGKRKHISYSGTYTVSGGQANQLRGGSYDTQSNLLDLTQRVQDNLSNQLSRAISQHHTAYGHRTTGIETEMHGLEDELRANLTRKLQEELSTQYGQETRRGSHSYSSSQAGHLQSRPNYNTQELDDLTQQVQTNLLDQLRREYQTQSSSSAKSSYTKSSSYGSNLQPYGQPSRPAYYQPSHQISSSDYNSRAHTTMYTQSTPTVQPRESLVDVTSKAQNELDMILNRALSYLKTRYLNDETYNSIHQPNYDVILNDLSSELKRNISMELDNALRNAYGYQEEKNGYYFSTWNVNANIANYKTEDLTNLRRQVEKNLLDKLTQEVRNQKSSYVEKKTQYESRRHSEMQTHNSWERYPSTNTNNNQYSSQSQYSGSSSYGVHYPSNRYPSYNAQNRDDQQQVEEIDYQYQPQTQRPASYIAPDTSRYPSSGNTYSKSHSASSESSYQYTSGNRQSGTQAYQVPTAELSTIQDELNRDLSQQVQTVIQQQRDQGHVYSASQTNQAAVDDLTEEFKRNFSRRVEEVLKEHGVRGGYSFMITSTENLHNGQNNDRFVEQTNKLQDELLRQLREGLSRQSYHSSLNSSSSSSSSYQPIKYSSYGSAGGSSAYTSGSYGGHSGSYGMNSGGYGMQSAGYGSSSGNYERSGSYAMKSGYRGVDYQQGGECCMQSDEATSPQNIKPPRARADIPVDLEAEPDDNKPTERPKARDVVTAKTTPKTTSLDQQQTLNLEELTQDISRQLDALTQQSTGLIQKTVGLNQQSSSVAQSDLTQKTEDFRHLDQQQSLDLTQKTEDFRHFDQQQSSDLTQKTEDFRHFDQQQSSDLTQKTEDFRHFDQQQSSDFSQKTEDFGHIDQQSSDLTQWNEDFSHFDQKPSDIIQQTEDLNHFDQQISGLTQETENFDQSAQINKKNDIIKQTDEFPIQKQEAARVEQTAGNSEGKIENSTETSVETTTEQKGFWKKLGGKISGGLNTVKDKIQSIG